MMVRTILMACLLVSTAAFAHAPGERASIGIACADADDALEVGASIDRDLDSTTDLIHDKVVDGRCFVLLGALRHDDAVLVQVVLSAEKTDVWEVKTDTGKTLYVPYDREPSL